MPKFFIDLNVNGKVFLDQQGLDAVDYESARRLSLDTIAKVLEAAIIDHDYTVSATLSDSARSYVLRCTSSLLIERLNSLTEENRSDDANQDGVISSGTGNQ